MKEWAARCFHTSHLPLGPFGIPQRRGGKATHRIGSAAAPVGRLSALPAVREAEHNLHAPRCFAQCAMRDILILRTHEAGRLRVDHQRAAYQAFCGHASGAKRRGILFQFSFEEWWAWWQVDNRWEHRGPRKGQYCMARRGDAGPYHPDNVYCATNEENAREKFECRSGPARMRRSLGGRRKHLGRVRTPAGEFPNVPSAAKAAGISLSAALSWIRAGGKGWAFIEDGPGAEAAPIRLVEAFGINLRFYRKAAGLTQQIVADRCKISRPMVCLIEGGAENPSLDTILGLAAAVGQPIRLLLDEKSPAVLEALSAR